jgi:hypothetical protein
MLLEMLLMLSKISAPLGVSVSVLFFRKVSNFSPKYIFAETVGKKYTCKKIPALQN